MAEDGRPLEVGYWLSSEEHPPAWLVENAVRAEEVGFPSAVISDHFHPWTPRQGESPFVWGVLGAIAQATERLRVGTGVTAPIIRTHPVVIAQAAATAAALMPGRFFLGVGAGERLNEHVVGQGWPRIDVRREMLEEAVEVIRRLWEGKNTTHRGAHFTVEDARIFSSRSASADHGGRKRQVERPPGRPYRRRLRRRDALGREHRGVRRRWGQGKPRIGQVHVCWAEDESTARRVAHEWWPNGALPGPVLQELSRPEQFAAAAELVGEADVAEAVVCGPDPERHLAAIAEFASAGFDHVYVHQVGSDQEGFFAFYEREILSRLS